MTLDADGAELQPDAVSEPKLAQLQSMIADLPDRPGNRLNDLKGLSDWLGSVGLTDRASKLLGRPASATRALLFNKTAGANWTVGWHQDRTIAIRKRVETAGFSPWTVKDGIDHVEPPYEWIERSITLRLHIDRVSGNNGPLRVALGSHRLGRIAEDEIPRVVERCEVTECLADRGDAWWYRTSILHASSPSLSRERRRVLQVDFAAGSLPGALQWRGVD